MRQPLLIISFVIICQIGVSQGDHDKLVNFYKKNTVKPHSQGVIEDKMILALSYLESKSFNDGIEEVIIIRNGKIIYEGDSTLKAHSVYSCSKSFTGMVLGLLIAENKVALNDTAAHIEWSLNEHYPGVTLRHFATMTSGYSAVGRSRWNDENSDWSVTPYNPDTPHFIPGTHFEYWDEAMMMFGRVLTIILNQPMKEYLTERITGPMGMGEWYWDIEQHVNGIPINNGCTGVRLNAKQLAMLGILYLNKGNWNGKQLLPEDWCTASTSVQVPVSLPVFSGDRADTRGSGSYGYNWWVNSSDGMSKMPDAPLHTAYMSGKNHNVCMIIPEWKMVIVRMGDDMNPPEGKHVVWNHFLDLLGDAVSQ